MSLSGKKILLGVTGGIAAYKAPLLVRALKKQGADVQVVMSSGAAHFTTGTTLQAVSGHPVRDSLWDASAEASMGHIELARWADAIIIAPATADVIARLANGFANDLLTTLCLATDAPMSVAPAMNRLMWENRATQTNVLHLEERGFTIIGPAEGEQACGETGVGRMLEPEDIVQELINNPKMLKTSTQVNESLLPTKNYAGLLKGLNILITAGPTQEAIDPVRYITNHSSGKMGYALAKMAALEGGNVTLVSGPVTLATPAGVTRIDVRSALEMHEAVMASLKKCEIFIGTAAVADYRPDAIAEQKIKKDTANPNAALELSMQRNPDILASVAQINPRPLCVGFAAETENLESNALKKLREKKIDMIAANLVGENLTFGQDESSLKVFWKGGSHVIPTANKEVVAAELIKLMNALIQQNFAQTMVR